MSSSASLNIGGSALDASYRYKMPSLTTKIEGRGNGIKTVIVNMTDVAKALHVHPAYPTKFFGIELGAQSKYSGKEERSIVNGAHSANDLQNLMKKFIDVFILCPTCHLPELHMSIGARSIKITCDACGYSGILNTPHKLSGYIQKNPPSVLDAAVDGGGAAGEDGKTGKKLSKEEKKAARLAKKAAAKGVGGGGDSDVEGEFNELDIDDTGDVDADDGGEKRHRKQKKDKKKKDPAAGAAGGDDALEDDEVSEIVEDSEKVKKKKKKKSKDKERYEDSSDRKEGAAGDAWHTDTSKEAVKARKTAELAEMRRGSNSLSDDASAAVVAAVGHTAKSGDPVGMLRNFLNSPHSSDQIVAELKRLSMARGYDDAQRYGVFLSAVLPAELQKSFPLQIQKYSEVLRKLISSNPTQQSSTLIHVIELYIGEQQPQLLPSAAHIFKALYDSDVLTEQQIINWYDLPADNPLLNAKNVSDLVHLRAKVFVEWLKEADDGESDGDED